MPWGCSATGEDIGDELTAPQRIHRVFVIPALEVNVAVQIPPGLSEVNAAVQTPGLSGYVVEES